MLNPYQPPHNVDWKPATRWRAKLSAWTRLASCCAFWLPCLGIIVFFVPKFESMYVPLQGRGELPTVTEWLLSFALLNKAMFYLPCVFVLALLMAADVGAERLSRRWRWAYGLWLAVVFITGIVAALAVVIVLLLPVIVITSTI